MTEWGHAQYLRDTIDALTIEIAAARSSPSPPTPLEAGRRLDADPMASTFRWQLIYESALPEGIPVRLEIAGVKWDAEILQRDGLKVLLLVKRSERGVMPPPTVASALLHADPVYLLEALADAVRRIADSGRASIPATRLLGWLDGGVAPPVDSGAGADDTAALNAEQARALSRCADEPVWFVWGPPGTGKTTTLGHVVAQAVESRECVLVTAHSNVAVDAALVAGVKAGIADRGLTVVRAGPAVRDEARVTGLSTREIALARDPELQRRWEALSQQLSRSRDGSMAEVIEEWRRVRSELKEREAEILSGADVVFATLSKLVIDPVLADREFDVAVVDEVSMTFPAQVVVAANVAVSRLNVFGDCRQLPPIVQSEHPRPRQLLGRDVFTACRADQPSAPGVTMLREQYRMHPAIRCLVSEFAYGGQLRDGPHMEEQRRQQTGTAPFCDEPVVWYEVGGLGARHFVPDERTSRFNVVSAIHSISLAIESATRPVVVLTPYRRQARLLAALVLDAGLDDVEVGTIHRFQGSEAPVVILDLVDGPNQKRSRLFHGRTGDRLLNVGFSRAQAKLIVVACSASSAVDVSPKAVKVLAAVQASHTARPDLPTRSQHGSFHLSIDPGLVGLDGIARHDIRAGWFPSDVPNVLRDLRGPAISPWPSGPAVWLHNDGRVSVHVLNARRPSTMLLSEAPRFSEALADAIAGAPLTRRSPGADVSNRSARHDACSQCDGDVVPSRATKWSIELTCRKCGAERRASAHDIESWLRQIGPRCRDCRSALKLVAGPRAPFGPFLGCTVYPKCTFHSPLDALVDAVDRPDPPPVDAPRTGAKRRRPPPVPAGTRQCQVCFVRKGPQLFPDGGDTCVDCFA